MHAISEDQIGYALFEDPPPSANRLTPQPGACSVCSGGGSQGDGSQGGGSQGGGALPADGWNGGCSVCRLVALYDTEVGELVLSLPADVEPPDELEVEMLVLMRGDTRSFHLGADAVATLLSSREVRCYPMLPRNGPMITQIRLSCAYRQGDATGTRSLSATFVSP
jgi:hypothetical protein